MPLISDTAIIVRDRQRKKIATSPLNELKTSIRERGLMNAPVFFGLPDGGWLLIAGERRLRAIRELHAESVPIVWNGEQVPVGSIPCGTTHLTTELEHKRLEYDENKIREALSWQEETEALANIHALLYANSATASVEETGRIIAAQGGLGLTDAKNPKVIAREVREAVRISKHLADPTIAKARNAAEAHSLILKKEEEAIRTILAERSISRAPIKGDIEIRQGDLLQVLPALDDNVADLIAADPPYGIDAGSGGFRSRTVHHHNYTDDEATARAIFEAILVDGFRVCKARANIFLFTDIKFFDWLLTSAARIGWTPFRRPLIWGKSDSEGLAPWGAQGPRITTEFIFYATKGQKGLVSSPIDYLRENRVDKAERTHAAEKPVPLMKRLIECATLPGDFVLDPCCGSGSTLMAAKELKRKGLGIEKDPSYYATAMANVFGEG